MQIGGSTTTVSSDHKPLSVMFKDLRVNMNSCPHVTYSNCRHTLAPDWPKADDYSLLRYETMLNDMLNEVDIPESLMGSDYAKVSKNEAEIMIDNYYEAVTTRIKQAVHMNIPHSVKGGYYNEHTVAGWNDVVKDKHDAARAFLDWVENGKPRQGPLFSLMNSTRAAFKLSMRYCKQHEDMIRADNLASRLLLIKIQVIPEAYTTNRKAKL